MLAQQTCVQGFITREVKDVRLGLGTLIGYDLHDPFVVPLPLDNPFDSSAFNQPGK